MKSRIFNFLRIPWNQKLKDLQTLIRTKILTVFQAASEHFGGGSTDRNHNIIKTVMDKTGAKIEMSSSKDQSLTFLISGKNDIVLKARRELLVQFQTQASSSISVPKEHHRYILGMVSNKMWMITLFGLKHFKSKKVNNKFDIFYKIILILVHIWNSIANFEAIYFNKNKM